MSSPEESPRFISRLTRETVALVLAGGRGTRLRDLTRWRAKPAVPFGGIFRIIDFSLSNCINSGVRKIGVVTQYKSHSLIRHVQRGWSFLRGELGDFIDLLPASQRIDETWYQGTADAVYQNLDILRSYEPRYVLILAGDHVYKMDYGPMIAFHKAQEADMTVGCIEVDLDAARDFGVMQIDETQRIVEFAEKPQQPKPLPNNPKKALASMGIYVFGAAKLAEVLTKDAKLTQSTHDFGKDIIPSLIQSHKVCAYSFRSQGDDPPYWRDVGTIDAYWQASMELIAVSPELNLYDKSWPIWTHPLHLPPAKFVFDDDGRRGMAVDSMVSAGSVISGAHVKRSLLSYNVHVHSYARLDGAVILPEVDIGRGAIIRNAVIDKGCKIPEEIAIGVDHKADRERFYVSPGGVVLVTRDMLGQERKHD